MGKVSNTASVPDLHPFINGLTPAELGALVRHGLVFGWHAKAREEADAALRELVVRAEVALHD